MSILRLAVIAALVLGAVSCCDFRHPALAQNGSLDGSVVTQNITPQGNVITQSVLPDGRVITQNITPDGAVLSDGSVTAGRGAPRPLLSPATLRSGLDVCVWDAGQRGPLLAVGPEAVSPAWQKIVRKPLATFAPPQSPELLPGGRYRVPDLADYFGYRIVRLPGLSVLAPRDMVVLNTKLGKPDYFAGLSQDEKLQLLQASLSEAQWKLLGSEGGLGTSDLSGRQRELFIASLPNPLVIVKPRVYNMGSRSSGPDTSPVILSSSQRDVVRLRLNRAVVQVAVPFPRGGESLYISGDSIGTDYAAINYSSFGSDGNTVFGQKIRRTMPNRLKPQQIDFAAPALQRPVLLAGLKTVGDLIARIRTTTRVEIYVDGHVAKRTLWVRSGDTQTIRAGEALQALCWSLTGAVRYVSSGKSGVFILTEDLEGIGSRLALLKDWAQAAKEKADQTRVALQNAIREKQPLQYIGFAAGDPNALAKKANKAVEDGWKSPKRHWQGVSMPLTDLSAQHQEAVRQEIVSFNESSERRTRYDGQALTNTETLTVSVNIRPVFLVPGVGIVRDAGSFISLGLLLDTMLPPEVPFTSTKAVTGSGPADSACVSPATDEEARQVIRAAQEQGLKQVWLVLPLVPAAANDSETSLAKSKAILTAAISEAQKVKSSVKILAGVRVFRLPSPSQSAPLQTDASSGIKEQDVTITGELPSEMAKRRIAASIIALVDLVPAPLAQQMTHDWAAPKTLGITERIVRRLSEVAATAGVSGLVLLDASPLGYSLSLPNQTNRFRVSQHEDFASVGYNMRERAAFIRSAGSDPIDITSDTSVGGIDLRLPFLEPDVNSPQDNSAIKRVAEWNQFRSNLITEALADLYVPLMVSLPKSKGCFPVYLQNLAADSSNAAKWFSLWEKKDMLPRRGSSEQVLNFSEIPVGRAIELLQETQRPKEPR